MCTPLSLTHTHTHTLAPTNTHTHTLAPPHTHARTKRNLGAKWIKAIKHFVVSPLWTKEAKFWRSFDPDRIQLISDQKGSIHSSNEPPDKGHLGSQGVGMVAPKLEVYDL